MRQCDDAQQLLGVRSIIVFVFFSGLILAGISESHLIIFFDFAFLVLINALVNSHHKKSKNGQKRQ